ncbi:MAG TPA: hypothetical protein VFI97_03655 [Arthrobacter sp.]|nr:hypothetical protein [Arthrobacter sp.]
MANPVGAAGAISAFKKTVYAAGWKEVYAYGPLALNRDWVALWTNIRPTSLPAGWVGQQYGGKPGLDYSIFDADLLGVTVTLPQSTIDAIASATAAKVSTDLHTFVPAYMQAQFGGTVARIVTILGLEQQGAITLQDIKNSFSSGTVDIHALAQELEGLFGAALSTAATNGTPGQPPPVQAPVPNAVQQLPDHNV